MTDFNKHSYIVNGHAGFDLSTALRLWKTKYESDIRDFHKEVITHEQLKDFGQFVEECWNEIKPFKVEDAFQLSNTEVRRVYFDCIGVEKLFKSLDPQLLDKQVIKKKRTKWDDNNDPMEYEFEDVYELYKIEGEKLFQRDNWGRTANAVYAVRCWCTTTNREYWLYVPQEAATGRSWWDSDKSDPDAIRAIAWTIRIDITKPEKIYRQGDIIVAKRSKNSTEHGTFHHLTKEEYLSLMYSET